MRDAIGLRSLALGVVLIAAVGCGKKGPPLAPLVIVPAAVADVSASRFGDQVVVRFTPPDKNTDNSTPADLSRVDVYALSVARAADAPDGVEIIREGTRVGSIDLARKPTPGNAASDEPAGPRTFSETLTADTRRMWEGKTGSKGSTGSAEALRSRGLVLWIGPVETVGSTGVAVGEQPPQPLRVYAFVPVSGRGRRGVVTTVAVPLAAAPPPPGAPFVAYTETLIEMNWVAVPGVAGYNVYERDVSGSTGSKGSTGSIGAPGSSGSTSSVPLNGAPVKEPAFVDKRLEFGKARCYSVTSVALIATRRIESPMSDPACVTPTDTFPPAAPTGVAAVAGPGSISLIWDPVTAGDLAGYVVLRANAPDGTLQALTPEPIKDTTYRDATVTPGAQYAYVVLAVDKSNNKSAPSARVEETAR